ncbi:peptidylprolyl isomerase [Neolewinella lacunae]|uniref:Periplasmic chaperone PpiD n=1 Tax=Neolewinella lacunae TaxID=1517758 RepID=A0A923PM44_9BACT|nr:peptidylprolyl isomerase [Neolewinella lacunae]MBC6996698.1 peptidylprolyl isomerase [Neolewinella lacunae]MDN3633437.1 peptidylprolyl isomerase [Neolewinella lacunae]
MALIGKIRENTAIVLLFIGGGIALFILSEMTSGANGPIGPVEQAMGRVGEREIDRAEFERTLSGAFNGGDAYQNRDNLWQFYVNEGLVAEEAESIGLAVTEEELTDLEFGPNPSPVVARNLTDPNTGQLNRNLLSQIQGHIDNNTLDDAINDGTLNPNIRTIWKYQRREVVATRLQEKMGALVSKAMYAPSWQAQAYADEQIKSRQFAVVKVPFDKIADTEVTVEDADVQAYIDENRSVFNNPEETRLLSYVSFKVEPTAEDSAAIRTQLQELAAEWREETTESGDSLFALANRGSYNGTFVAESALSPVISDVVLNQLEKGAIYGPYVEGNAMKLLKLVDRRTMSDSASTRHILREASTPAQFTEANRVIDSLMNVLQANRGKFASLAETFSQDPGSASEGGVYKKVTPGQFVKPFDNVLFVTGEVGKLYKVRTSFGVHLVEVMSRSASTSPRAKVAYLVEPILPSNETEDATLAKAQTFLNGKNKLADLKAAAEAAGMEITTTNPLPISNYTLPGLGGGQEVKDMMCWAFSAGEGDVSGVVYTFSDPQLFYENNYVLVGLEDVIPAGVAPVAAVKEALATTLRDRAKGKKLAEMLAGKDLSAIAAQYEVEVDTLFSNPTLVNLPGLGREPKVVAAAAMSEIGVPSKPVVGNTGVYVVVAVSNPSGATSGNLPGARNQIHTSIRLQAANSILPALRVGAKIEDERAATDCR